MKCKHKHHEERNYEVGGYNIPDGCTTEYDIYCKDCGKKLGHWAYGYTDIGYYLNYELNWVQRIFAKLIIKLDDVKWKIRHKKIQRKFDTNNENLPF